MQDTYERAHALPHAFQSIPLAALLIDRDLMASSPSRMLSDSAFEREIAENGVQNPIVVDRSGDTSLRLLDGARRRAAAVLAGYTHIPAMVYETLSAEDVLLVQYASQNGEETLWTASEYPQILRTVLNAQLVAKKGGRYSSEYKWRILGLASDCTEWGELSRLLKTEGITHSHLAAWRRQFDETGSFEDRRIATKHLANGFTRRPQL